MQIGYYKLVLPVKYLNEDASEKDKEVAVLYKKYFQQLMDGKRKGMTFPALTDENGNYLFDLQYVGPSNLTIVNNNTEQQPAFKHMLRKPNLNREEFEELRGKGFASAGRDTVSLTTKYPTWESMSGSPLYGTVTFSTYEEYIEYTQ